MSLRTDARSRVVLLAALAFAATSVAGAPLASPDRAVARGKHALPRVRFGARPLKPHLRGTDVRTLQRSARRLKEPIVADGAYGKSTYKAVRRLERRRGWSVDGWVGRREAGMIQLAVQEQRDRRTARALAGKAQLLPDGTAVAPAGAPPQVVLAIDAANRIHTTPYIWGGGHGSWESNGYDCSGAVSYVLHAAGLLPAPMTSGALTHWGYPGGGQWLTVYGNRSHAWMTVAGLRFDTSSAGDSWNQGSGPRWRTTMRAGTGYAIRFSPGL